MSSTDISSSLDIFGVRTLRNTAKRIQIVVFLEFQSIGVGANLRFGSH